MKRLLITILFLSAVLPLPGPALPSGRAALLPRELQGQDVPQHRGRRRGGQDQRQRNRRPQILQGRGHRPHAAHLPLVLQPRRHLHGMDRPGDEAPRTFRKRPARRRLYVPELLQLRLGEQSGLHPLAPPPETLSGENHAADARKHGRHRALLHHAPDPTPTASSPASRRRSRWCFRTRSDT